MKLALSVTLSASTPRCSTTIFFTRSPISLIFDPRLPQELTTPKGTASASDRFVGLRTEQVSLPRIIPVQHRRDCHPRLPFPAAFRRFDIGLVLTHFICLYQRPARPRQDLPRTSIRAENSC
jgi:hypothetical protein